MSDQLGCLEKSELVTLRVDESFVELAQQKPNSSTHENRLMGKNDSHSRRWGSTLSLKAIIAMHLTQFNATLVVLKASPDWNKDGQAESESNLYQDILCV